MAKGLGSLVRLHKWQVDEKRRQITELEVMRSDLVSKLEKLAFELAKEQKNMTKSNIVDINYANYAANVMTRRENLNASIIEVDISIGSMKDELAESFKELKKYEIVEQRAVEREQLERKRLEQDRLDELSLNMYRSNQKSNG